MLEEIAVPHFRNSLNCIIADSLNLVSGGNEEGLERQLEWNCLTNLLSLPTFAVLGRTLLRPFDTPAVSCELFYEVKLGS